MRESRATPRQVAFLEYLGIKGARSMTFEEASDKLDEISEFCYENPESALAERRNGWFLDRFRLHLDIYRGKLFELVMDSEESYRSYVRARVVGASEKLTRERIESVVRSLLADDTFWWNAPDANERFFRQLGQSFPGCVDGRHPRGKAKVLKLKAGLQPVTRANPFTTGVGGLAVGCAIVGCVIFGIGGPSALFNGGESVTISRRNSEPEMLESRKPAKTAPTAPKLEDRNSVSNSRKLPTAVVTWESNDGRKALGSVTEIDEEAETVSLRLADGQEFQNYPIKNFSEQGQIFLLGRKATKAD